MLTTFLLLVTVILYFFKILACQSRELRSDPKPSSRGERQSALRANYCCLYLDIMDITTYQSNTYVNRRIRLDKIVSTSLLLGLWDKVKTTRSVSGGKTYTQIRRTNARRYLKFFLLKLNV